MLLTKPKEVINMSRLALFFLISILVTGCSLFDNSDEPKDFGVAEDHFQIVDGEKEFLKRNRNLLNVQFSNDYSWDEIKQVVSEYNLEFLSPDDNPTDSNFKTWLKVRSNPAEEYYTQYDSPNSPVFGNSDQVVFALPIYNLPGSDYKSLNNELMITFADHISDIEESRLVDSLKAADELTHIENEWLGDRFLLQVDKSSPMNSLELSNHYEAFDFLERANPSFGYALQQH